MRLGSILENQNLEKRIAITPEILKKYTSLGFKIYLSENYGSHIGINDELYKNLGAIILKDEIEILNFSDIIVQLGMLSDDKISNIKESSRSGKPPKPFKTTSLQTSARSNLGFQPKKNNGHCSKTLPRGFNNIYEDRLHTAI